MQGQPSFLRCHTHKILPAGSSAVLIISRPEYIATGFLHLIIYLRSKLDGAAIPLKWVLRDLLVASREMLRASIL